MVERRFQGINARRAASSFALMNKEISRRYSTHKTHGYFEFVLPHTSRVRTRVRERMRATSHDTLYNNLYYLYNVVKKKRETETWNYTIYFEKIEYFIFI